jgi:hypothetical protein
LKETVTGIKSLELSTLQLTGDAEPRTQALSQDEKDEERNGEFNDVSPSRMIPRDGNRLLVEPTLAFVGRSAE